MISYGICKIDFEGKKRNASYDLQKKKNNIHKYECTTKRFSFLNIHTKQVIRQNQSDITCFDLIVRTYYETNRRRCYQ